jgi:hypothetical protein
MRKLHGEQATRVHSPKEGQTVVIYRHKFKPEHYRKGLKHVTSQFPDVQLKLKQKCHNIFLRRPSTHSVVTISFFDEETNVHDYHEAVPRVKAIEKMRPMLEELSDIQVYEVERIVGVG